MSERDIVEELRAAMCCDGPCRVRDAKSGCRCAEVADELDRRSARVAELGAANKTLFDYIQSLDGMHAGHLCDDGIIDEVAIVAADFAVLELAKPTNCAWRPIDTAPKDGSLFLVWAPTYEGLPAMYSLCAWHPDAGFCIDELREPLYWTPLPKPPAPRKEVMPNSRGAETETDSSRRLDNAQP